MRRTAKRVDNISIIGLFLFVAIFVGGLVIYHYIFVRPTYLWAVHLIKLEEVPYSILTSYLKIAGALYGLFGLAITILAFFGFKRIESLKEIEDNLYKRFRLIEGEVLYDRRKYSKAWEIFQDLTDDNWEVCLYKGLVERAFSDRTDALYYFSKALKFPDCNRAEILVDMGDVYIELGEYKLAIEKFEEAIRERADYAIAYYKKGYAERRLHGPNGPQKALETIEAGIRIDGTIGLLHYNRACYLSVMGKVDDAVNALREAIDRDPDLRMDALGDEDFANIKDSGEYRKLVLCLPLKTVEDLTAVE